MRANSAPRPSQPASLSRLTLYTAHPYASAPPGTRWACSKRYGANAEEEWVNGALQWVHYVR